MIDLKIRKCTTDDIQEIHDIINEAAKAYGAVVPSHAYHEPQMTVDELLSETKRIRFYAAEADGRIVGVIGYEYVGEGVALIRHAYVKPNYQRRGIGSQLLKCLEALIENDGFVRKIIIGTYKGAYWALAFYQKHGYRFVADHDKVLRSYYDIPTVQRENSLALEKKIRQK